MKTIGKYKEPELVSRSLTLEWDDESAQYIYVLSNRTKFYGNASYIKHSLFQGSIKVIETGEPKEMSSIIATGDVSWAKRIAKKYNLRMPK
jgi:hypothetical protein